MSHSSSTEHRDYRLTGPEAARAAEKGLVSASWYQCPISRKRLKELRQLGTARDQCDVRQVALDDRAGVRPKPIATSSITRPRDGLRVATREHEVDEARTEQCIGG